MRHDVFSGRDLSTVWAEARAKLGDDALIVRTRSVGSAGRSWIEVEAAAGEDVARLVQLVTPPKATAEPAVTSDKRRVRIIAVIGPTGAGKTTTLAKLAVNPSAFGGRKVGFLTLDTHRAGALEQLQAYADAAGLPCEIAYDRAELAAARKCLTACDVLLIDTPGRGPRHGPEIPAWRRLLTELQPHETHLVVPATTRADIVARMREDYAPLRPTHTLLTKLDEVPADTLIAATVATLGMNARWITDGQDVPGDLHLAGPTVLAAIGIRAGETLS
jgi:flagellar biosynthesis protein FlhF